MSQLDNSFFNIITQHTNKYVQRIQELEGENKKRKEQLDNLANYVQRVQELEAENKKLKEQVSTLKTELETTKSKSFSMEQFQALRSAYDELKADYANLNDRHNEIKVAYAEADKENMYLRKQMEENKIQMGNIIQHLTQTSSSIFNQVETNPTNQSNDCVVRVKVSVPAESQVKSKPIGRAQTPRNRPNTTNPYSPPRDQKEKHRASKMVLKNMFETDSETETSESEDESPRPTLFPLFRVKKPNNPVSETKEENKQTPQTELDEKILEEAFNVINQFCSNPEPTGETKNTESINPFKFVTMGRPDSQEKHQTTQPKVICIPMEQLVNKTEQNPAQVGKDLVDMIFKALDSKQEDKPQETKTTEQNPNQVGKEFVNMIFKTFGSNSDKTETKTKEQIETGVSLNEKAFMDALFANMRKD